MPLAQEGRRLLKGIILAAGEGGRLRPLTVDTPKVLLDVGGSPLIHYPITALRLAGVTEITVVLGHNARKVEDVLSDLYPEIRFLLNKNYSLGNALSIGVARDFTEDDPFLVCMGDHPINREIIESLLAYSTDGNILCVDYEASLPAQLNDATRVLVAGNGYIDEIGKSLKTWNAIDTGVFKMTSAVFSAIDLLSDVQAMEVEISDVVRLFGTVGQPFATCDIDGAFWSDIDTLDDYSAIKTMLN